MPLVGRPALADFQIGPWAFGSKRVVGRFQARCGTGLNRALDDTGSVQSCRETPPPIAWHKSQ